MISRKAKRAAKAPPPVPEVPAARRTLADTAVDALADGLLQATRTRRPILPLTMGYPDMTAADAYAVQERIVTRRIRGGETIVGWKLGLTSRAMQTQLGVDQPDYGPILSGHLVAEGETIALAGLIQPRVEAEIAFILARPLRGPGMSVADARAAIGTLATAIEIIDSRIRDWQIGLPDTIADLASSARVAVGAGRLALDDSFQPRFLGAVLERNGEVVQTGAGAAVLGDPLAALAWAANTLGPLGVTMEAGHLVMTGALHASVPAAVGDTFRATVDRVGDVTVRFG